MIGLRRTFVLFGFLAVGLPAAAQNYPAHPIKLVSPNPVGGANDTVVRIVSAKMSALLNAPIVIENRGGAGGKIGADSVAHSLPDGYTLLIAGSGPHLTGPAVNSNIGYDPMRDFTHIAMIGGDGYALAANPALGVRSLAELLTLARHKPLAAASPGPGSLGHLLLEQLKRKANVDIQHIPSPGGGVTDVVGNHVPMALTALLTLGEHIHAGTLVALAVASTERIPAFADVPTFTELGYPDVRGTTWFWLASPKELPASIIDKLSRGVRRIVQLPRTKQRFERQSLLAMDLDVGGLNKFLSDELEFWIPLAKDVGLKVE